MAYAHRYHKSSRVIYKYRPSRRQWNFRRTLDTIKIPISNDAYLTKVITIHFLVFHSFPSRIYIPSDLISRFCAPNSLRVFLIHLKKKKKPSLRTFRKFKKKKKKKIREQVPWRMAIGSQRGSNGWQVTGGEFSSWLKFPSFEGGPQKKKKKRINDNADETMMVRRGKWQFAAISRKKEENSLHSNL